MRVRKTISNTYLHAKRYGKEIFQTRDKPKFIKRMLFVSTLAVSQFKITCGAVASNTSIVNSDIEVDHRIIKPVKITLSNSSTVSDISFWPRENKEYNIYDGDSPVELEPVKDLESETGESDSESDAESDDDDDKKDLDSPIKNKKNTESIIKDKKLGGKQKRRRIKSRNQDKTKSKRAKIKSPNLHQDNTKDNSTSVDSIGIFPSQNSNFGVSRTSDYKYSLLDTHVSNSNIVDDPIFTTVSNAKPEKSVSEKMKTLEDSKNKKYKFKQIKLDTNKLRAISDCFDPNKLEFLSFKNNKKFIFSGQRKKILNLERSKLTEVALSTMPMYFIANKNGDMVLSIPTNNLLLNSNQQPLKLGTKSYDLATGLFFTDYNDAVNFCDLIRNKDESDEILYPSQKNRDVNVLSTNLGSIYGITNKFSGEARFCIVPALDQLVEVLGASSEFIGTPMFQITSKKVGGIEPRFVYPDGITTFKPIFMGKKEAVDAMRVWKKQMNSKSNGVFIQKLTLQDFIETAENTDYLKTVHAQVIPNRQSYIDYLNFAGIPIPTKSST